VKGVSKTWQTKKKILKLISKGVRTPGEISDKLGLAPSTVSEHIDELERMGAVKQKGNPFIKKWKYYEPNPNFDFRSMLNTKKMRGIPQIATALAIVLGLVALLAFGLQALGALVGGQPVVFSLTDPPSVPNGTQSLNITYSSLQAHYLGANNASAWVSGSGGGSLDLMTLVNASQVIGTGKIPVNSTINIVRFSITSAYIVINGTKYNVTVPSGELTVPVTGGGRVTSNSSVLIDLSPVVATIYTSNSTVFVLVPSVKAVIVGNVSASLGRHALTPLEREKLKAATPAISISSASLEVINNSTVRLSVTVKNNANESVDLRHVMLFGIPSVMVSQMGANSEIEAQIDALPEIMRAGMVGGDYANAPAAVGESEFSVHATANTSIGSNTAGNASVAASGHREIPEIINGVHVMIEAHGNASANVSVGNLTGSYSRELGDLVRVGAEVRLFRVLNFIVTANGTLVLPFLSGPSGGCKCPAAGPCPMAAIPCLPIAPIASIENGTENGFGYVLGTGASVTLTFNGQIEYADGHLKITPVIGSRWKLVVQGEQGAEATTNVTVTSA
jgi:DNA-binding transcriptional ArsR family regulator